MYEKKAALIELSNGILYVEFFSFVIFLWIIIIFVVFCHKYFVIVFEKSVFLVQFVLRTIY